MTRFRMFWKLVREGIRIGRPLTKDEARKLLLAPELRTERRLLYATIGQLVMIWSGTEVLLDMINVIILNETSSQHSQLPEQLGRKIKVFEESFRDLDELADFRERATAIIAEVKELKEMRHDIIHGHSADRLPDGMRAFIRHGYRGKNFVENVKHYSIEEINNKAGEMVDLNEKLIALVRELIAFFKNKPERLYG